MSKYKLAANKHPAEIKENKVRDSKQFINPNKAKTVVRIESTLSRCNILDSIGCKYKTAIIY
jgi:hypothetical protein